ncbi:MAG: site-2 protease family protein, partial [Micrococcales bacterium]|nr:site-2 protease family protein [Micrococcales bacterium]
SSSEARRPVPSGRWSAMIEDARTQSMSEVGPQDGDRVFYKLSTPKKIVVMLGGPAMNLVLATLIFTGLVLFNGVGVAQPGAQVTTVVQCVRPVDAANRASAQQPCTAADAPSPAAAAGLKPGDRFVSIAGQPVTDVSDIAAMIRPHAGDPLGVVVDRGGRQVTLRITPIANSVPQLDAAGAIVRNADGSIAMTTAGYIGTASAPPIAMDRSLSQVPTVVWTSIERTGAIILQRPVRMVEVWNAAFGPAERDLDGPISVVGVGRVAGEVTSGQVTDPVSGSALSTNDKVVMLWTMLGGLNIALLVFNLIPLLPLDGGHIAGAIWEAIKRGFARISRRPDPGYVDVAKGLPIAYAMSILLITMSALLIYADIVKPVKL